MNIATFDNRMNEINSVLVITKRILKFHRDFPARFRMKFNESLEKTRRLLIDDRDYEYLHLKNWHLAHRVVQLNELYSKIEKISHQILGLRCPPYFTQKIPRTILPLVAKRIDDLKKTIGFNERLPFSVGQERGEYLHSATRELDLQVPEKAIKAEKEFFHLLANSLDSVKLNEIDIERLNGSNETYSILSWKRIISSFIAEGTKFEKFVGRIILDNLEKATPIALKMSFAYSITQIEDLKNSEAEYSYYRDFVEYSRKTQESKNDEFMIEDQFLEKYMLSRNGRVPIRVMINEIVWDIKDEINLMQDGDSRIFTFGTCAHSIAVQIICWQKPSASCFLGKYEYKIFNTGNGVDRYHYIEGDKIWPVIYEDLPHWVFSYSFIFELIRLYLQKSTVKEFYEIHDRVLVKYGRGKKDIVQGKYYLSQKHGTCSYSAIEAWIDSYLCEENVTFLELIKAKMSTVKQKKVVDILEHELTKTNESLCLKRSAIKSTSPMKRQKLDDSRMLLILGEQHLKQLENNFKHLKKRKLFLYT